MSVERSNKTLVDFLKFFAGLVLLFILFFAVLVMLGNSGRETTAARQETAPSPTPKEAYCTKIGNICRLEDVGFDLKGRRWVPTARTIKAYDEFWKAKDAKDNEGMAQLVASGDILPTMAGDEIRLLDISPWRGRTEGRMMSGQAKGARVYVPMKWVVWARAW